jgi:sphinganine-1-phosphate aldolase
MDVVKSAGCGGAKHVVHGLNHLFRDNQPWQVSLKTGAVCITCTWAYMYLSQLIREGDEVLTVRVRKFLFSVFRSLPIIKQKIAAKVAEERGKLDASLFRLPDNMTYIQQLPQQGLSTQEIMDRLREYQVLARFHENKLSGQLYNNSKSIRELNGQVFEFHSYSNPLHADVFQDIRKIEAETVRMVCNMFRGSSKTCGVVTTGGTESLLLAVVTARNWAYGRGVRYPEIVMPVSAHAAFDKACHYFRVKCVHVAVDKKTMKADVKAMKRAINGNTCLLVGSTPQYPHGAMDDIEGIAALGLKYNVPVHVDACLGGFVIAFLEAAGHHVPPFDFRLPGVWSISCDTHKYGYAPKGTSTLLFKDVEYMQNVYFSQPDWPGGIYATSTTGGSRSGALIATAWASMLHFGLDGYIETADKVARTTQNLAKAISEIEGLRVMGEPFICAVSWTSDQFDIFRQLSLMKDRGWILGSNQFPSGIHMTITMQHTVDGWIEDFSKDIRETAQECLIDPSIKAEGEAAMYGLSQAIPDRSIIDQLTFAYYDRYYNTQ